MTRSKFKAVSKAKRSKLLVWNYWLYWAGLLCVIAAALAAFGIIGAHRGRSAVKSSPIAQAHTEIAATHAVPVESQRIYPYSVIPGGAHSPRQLRDAIAHDPLVAQHYANFDASRARVIRLAHTEEMYVSYRLDDHIYWTKKRLTIYQGEALLTDGQHQARTRCGNRLSATPMQPVSPKEPPAAAMSAPSNATLVAENRPIAPRLPIDPLPVLGTPLAGPPANPVGWLIPPPDYPLVGGGAPYDPQQTPPSGPPVEAPEPSALLMLVVGLAALYGVREFARRRKSRRA
jgi:hypothetical protein